MNIVSIRPAAVGILATAALTLSSGCGASSSATTDVATLGTGGGTAVATTVAVNTQDALLAYAQCMRDNGVDMKDPTFDADGNPSGGGFGPNSGVDRSAPEFETARQACGSLLQGVAFGGRGGNRPDQAAIQAGLTDFTACLRDAGLQVDDITFGQGRGGGPGDVPGSSVPGGDGQGGGFGPPPSGPPDDGSQPAGGDAPGGAGFNPTDRLIARLGLDTADPAVAKALDTCTPILTQAFTPPSTTAAP